MMSDVQNRHQGKRKQLSTKKKSLKGQVIHVFTRPKDKRDQDQATFGSYIILCHSRLIRTYKVRES